MGRPAPGHNRIAVLQQDVVEIAHRIASAVGVAEGTVEKLLERADARSE